MSPSVTYLDSSALIKLVVEEVESEALRRYLGADPPLLTSCALARTEVMRSVGPLGAKASVAGRALLRRLHLIAIDDALLERAATLQPATLRTLDAIHLATAMSIADDLTALVAYDRRMLEAAGELGLPTASPV